MASVGKLLRQARIQQGLDLAGLAVRTRIKESFLDAIESDSRETLPPGGFFYKSFVRQYAAALSLDFSTLELEVDRALSLDKPLPIPGQNENGTGKPRIPGGLYSVRRSNSRMLAPVAALLFVVAGCTGFYSWWSTRQPARAPAPVVAVVSKTVPQAPPPAIPTPEPAAVPADVATPPLHLEFKAVEKTWVRLSSDGNNVFSGVLEAEQTRTVDGQDNAKLFTGNAGGLEVRWNGRFLGTLGTHGQVRRVLFTRDEYKILNPSPDDSTPAAVADASR